MADTTRDAVVIERTFDAPVDLVWRMWFTGEYQEAVENQRLVYTESMADENGNVLPAEEAGLPAGHPTTTEITVDLADVDGKTRMTMTHAGVPEDSPGPAGWNMAFDQLATHLDTQG